MATIFTKIVNGEIPCHKVWEDEDHFAFLDIRPVARGHTLVIPKKETNYLFDLSEEEHAALWTAAHKVARKLKQVVGTKRVLVGVWGWEVPHVHIHLVPSDGREFPMPTPMGGEPDHAALAELARQLAD